VLRVAPPLELVKRDPCSVLTVPLTDEEGNIGPTKATSLRPDLPMLQRHLHGPQKAAETNRGTRPSIDRRH
jgi:hypothetical protein